MKIWLILIGINIARAFTPMVHSFNQVFDRSWYVVAEANEIKKSKPFKATIWGKDYVLWKTDKDTYNALEDVCPHKSHYCPRPLFSPLPRLQYPPIRRRRKTRLALSQYPRTPTICHKGSYSITRQTHICGAGGGRSRDDTRLTTSNLYDLPEDCI